MQLNYLHDQIANQAGNEIACAIRLDWIVKILSQQIASSKPADYHFQTTDPKISAGLDFDMSKFELTINNGDILMKGFHPVILVKESQDPFRNYNTIDLEFPDIVVQIDIVSEAPKFVIKNASAPNIVKGNPDLQVITDNGLTAAEYDANECAIVYLLPYLELLDQFADSVTIPNALPAMSLIKLKPPYKYFNLEDPSAVSNVHYFVVTGTPELSFDENCGCKTDSVQRFETRQPNGAEINGTALTYPGRAEIPNINNPSVLFYIPKVSIDLFSDSVLKPAVTADGEGQFMLFKWYWNVAANIKRLNIQFDPATMKIIINSAHDIFGNAGVSLKIACIYQRIIGADFDGDIDPSTLELQLGLDNANNVMLYGTYKFKLDVDLNFLAGLDLLLNPILDSILANLVKDKYEFTLKLFNNTFLNLNKFQPAPKSGWRISKDFKTDSFCLGLVENDG